jgi:hypothetical protein
MTGSASAFLHDLGGLRRCAWRTLRIEAKLDVGRDSNLDRPESVESRCGAVTLG